MKNKNTQKKVNNKDENKIPDSLLYPPNEDIYSQFHKEMEIDPEDISKRKLQSKLTTSEN